jgi:alpha-glucuronidase
MNMTSSKPKRVTDLLMKGVAYVIITGCLFVQAFADDGYRLWMRYEPIADTAYLRQCRETFTGLLVAAGSPEEDGIKAELTNGIGGLIKGSIPLVTKVDRDGVLVVGTPKDSPLIASLPWVEEIKALGPESYLIRSTRVDGHAVTVVAASAKAGALYGSFELLRLIQVGSLTASPAVNGQPKLQLRLLNHWDNLNGKIPNEYSGKSIWTWPPAMLDRQRVTDYARANASIGINGAVLNDVNANKAYLNADNLKRAAEIADILRPYNIRVYLSAKFTSPIEKGGLRTADPLDPAVVAYWKKKTDQIYALIPDFGGFLVKADSEGMAGPMAYGRTHVDGANMFASVLAPHGGIVMWRTFVYDKNGGVGREGDRAAQAYDQFHGFDGKFAPNVMLQVKNGPIDFQPREPFHPLWGAMPKTALIGEVQIVQEYTGVGKTLLYLGTMWKEFLQADTFSRGPGSTVSMVLQGRLSPQRLTGIAGVANLGNSSNWCEHPFAQANWYAFGRLAWDPELGAEEVAREWVRMTFQADRITESKIVTMMMGSREAFVSYQTPLGLTHLMGTPHSSPRPSLRQRYHHADEHGIGFDRTSTGSDGVGCYHPLARDTFADPKTCPESLILWFHHLPWDHQMASGKSLWEELCLHYQTGVDWTHHAGLEWEGLSGKVNPEQHQKVAQLLVLQEKDAERWRDVCLTYFQTFSKRPYPANVKVTPAVVK